MNNTDVTQLLLCSHSSQIINAKCLVSRFTQLCFFMLNQERCGVLRVVIGGHPWVVLPSGFHVSLTKAARLRTES